MVFSIGPEGEVLEVLVVSVYNHNSTVPGGINESVNANLEGEVQY